MNKNLIVCILAISVNIFSLNAKKEGIRTQSLPEKYWEVSQWISVKEAPVVTGKVKDGDRAADGSNWFMSKVKNPHRVKSAKWTSTALGIYDIYINGEMVGEEVLKPGYTHPDKTRRSFTYDITSILNCGEGAENTFAAQVTPGWWADKIVTPYNNEGMKGRKCAFRGVLELTFVDGTNALYGTKTEDWRGVVGGPVAHAGIYDGEVYDARIEPCYNYNQNFDKPEANHEFKGAILPSSGGEVYHRDDLALRPVSAYVWQDIIDSKDGEYGKVKILRTYGRDEPITLVPGETLVVDFGQNAAAVPEFVFSASEGTKFTCKFGELLNDGNGSIKRGMDGPEGSVHRTNLRIPETGMYVEYTFGKETKTAIYRPRCTFFGYRYVTIDANDTVRLESLRSIPVTSITKAMEIGEITTGNPLINQLISNTIWGQRSNYLSVPTDCPQRNERLGWTADTQVFAETGSFFADTYKFFDKWMRDLTDSQGEKGGFPGVAPSGQYGGELMRVGWSDAGIIVPWTIWKQFGDTSIINQSWDSMDKYIEYIATTNYEHNKHIEENGNYQWADWLSYEPLESCGGGAFSKEGPLPEAIEYWNYLSACYLAIDASMMRDMALATGRDATRYKDINDRVKNHIAERFLNPDGFFKTDILNTMQTPALFALKVGVVEGEAKESMIKRLRENFKKHDNCLQTGFLGTSILMPTLTANGMEDIAYELLFQRKNPSWLYSIDNGATTIWERWNSYMKEYGMGPKGMNSFNHYAYGCVCQWLWNTAAGIKSDVAEAGFKHIVLEPIPDPRLGFMEARYHSAAGEIESKWRYEGDDWIWTFTIPAGSTASVRPVGQKYYTTYTEGTYTLTISNQSH